MGGEIRLRLSLMQMIMMMDATTEEKGSAEDRSMRAAADGISESLDLAAAHMIPSNRNGAQCSGRGRGRNVTPIRSGILFRCAHAVR